MSTTPLEPWSDATAVLLHPRRAERPMPGIRVVRVITLEVVAALVALGILLTAFVDVTGVPPIGWMYGVAGFTAATLPFGFFTRQRRNEHFLRTARQSDAYGFYRGRILLGVAIGALPALIGFGMSFPADSMLPYLGGLAVSLWRIAEFGPTARDVAQLQVSMDEYQDPLDLAAILMRPAGSS